jgi:diguanylate cyclase (GGDEF)-like protein
VIDYHAQQSVHDPLTGALSRQSFASQFEAQLVTAQQHGHSLALLLIDIDYFKSVNDGFGHQRGDIVLAEVGRRLRAVLRDVDWLFRYGGDEFVLILPGVDQQHALTVAERLLHTVRDEPFAGTPPLSLSLSIGVALYPAEASDTHTLFARADRRSYLAKRAGRSRVVASDETAPAESIQVSDRLIERDNALATVRSFLDLHDRGVRGQLCVSGPGGVGRSALLAEVERLAAARQIAVLGVRGRLASRARVYGALAEALHPWPELSLQELTRSAGILALAAACRQRGNASLLLTIDNSAALDNATSDFLHSLLAHPELPHTSLAYVDSPESSRWVLAGSSTQLYLALQPLSPDGIRVWLRHTLQWEAPPEFIALLRQTGGLPATLEATIAALRANGTLIAKEHGWNWIPADEASVALPPPVPDLAPLLATQPAMVGRSAEIALLRRFLGEQRLVTVTGPAGIGKTRIALQTAAESQEQYRDGAAFVALGALTRTTMVYSALAGALRIEPGRNPDPRARVLTFLRGRRMLLVLDNAEHLPDLAPLVAELLEQAPFITLLVTSHIPLGIPNEALVSLAGLGALPNDDPAHSEAVQLFLHVVRGQHPEYSPSSDDLGAIAAICRLVGGVPLGIELAAAWAGSVACSQIAAALLARSVTSGTQASMAHSVQLNAAIDYSWSMLSAAEQRTLRALAVFQGGFTREAARRVAGASPFFVDALAAKHLLRPMLHGRYQMHGLLQAHAAAQLASRPAEQRRSRARHRAYYLALLRERTTRPDTTAVAAELHAELANIRAAWQQALADQRLGPLFGALRPLGRLYVLVARFDEGLQTLDGAIEWLEQRSSAGGRMERRVLAHALHQRANLLFYLGRRDLMLDTIQRVLGLLKGERQPRLEGAALLLWGIMLLVHSQLEAAREKLERAHTLAAGVRDWDVMIVALQHLCHVASLQGHGGRGAQYAERALVLAEREGYTLHARQTQFFLGFSRLMQERHPEARACFEQCVSFLYHDFSIGVLALVNLGATLLDMREYRQAAACVERAIYLTGEAGMVYYQALALRIRGLLALASGREQQAARDLETALTTLEGVGARRDAGRTRADLALLAHARGDNHRARTLAEEALGQAHALQSTLVEALALVPLGHAALALGNPADAIAAYQRAHSLFLAMGRRNRAAEISAWLAHATLAGGNTDNARALALAFAEQIGDGHNPRVFDGMVNPVRAVRECQSVLQTLGEPRATRCAAVAHLLAGRLALYIGAEGEAHAWVPDKAQPATIPARGFVVQ